MKSVATTFFILLGSFTLMAGGPSQIVLDYIEQYKDIAIREMIEYKIPASITLAQGILESGAGQSELAKKSNNHFGIKCHTDWTGEKVYYDDDAANECFRKYDHVEDSYRDHSEFLSKKGRYASLFELDPDDYKGWAKGLKAAGYATNPKYADILITTIEDYELYKYDKMSLADIKKQDKHDSKKEDKTIAENKNENKHAGKPEKKDNTSEKKQTNKKSDHFSWNGYSEEVFYYNRIPTVTVKDGETPESIAKEHGIDSKLLRDYNDIEDGRPLQAGEKCYLQPKRKKGVEQTHEVKQGETMWSISKDEGVRMYQLYKYNFMLQGQEPAVGEQIYLRHKRKDAVKIRTINVQTNSELFIDKKLREEKSETGEKSPSENAEEKQSEMIVPEENTNPVFIDMDAEEKPAAQEVQETAAPAGVVQPTPESTAGNAILQPPVKEPVYHIVQAKETLYGLSKMYHVSIAEMQQWNGLKDNAIGIGQQLIVGYK